jgi:hypothetical protein
MPQECAEIHQGLTRAPATPELNARVETLPVNYISCQQTNARKTTKNISIAELTGLLLLRTKSSATCLL